MNSFKSLTAALVLAGLSSVASASGFLGIAPTVSSVGVGGAFSVDVRGSNFTDNVVGGGFDLSFDPALLTLSSVVMDTVEWEFSTNPGVINNLTGQLTGVWFNAFTAPLPTGNFGVATLNFVAKGVGSSALTLRGNPDFPFANELVEVIDVSFGSARVNISAVPEPAAWASLALGLALLPALRRRARQG